MFDDVLFLRNGLRVIVGEKTLEILRDYYTDDLECPTKPDYSVDKVERILKYNVFTKTYDK